MWAVQHVRHMEVSVLAGSPFEGSTTYTSLLLAVAATLLILFH